MNKNNVSFQGHFPIKQLSLCVALAMHGLAMAQAQQDTASEGLPEIKVRAQAQRETTEGTGSYKTTGKSTTATPLGLTVRETPQTVTVITRQRIEDQGLRSITDVLNNTPGITVQQYETNRGQFTARGFDINTLMIDGVPTTWDQSWSSGETFTSMAIYDRVEVVHGATGLTTGAGSPGAAINMIRKRANATELSGSAEVSIGSWNQRRAMADVGTALNEAKTLRARVAAEYDDHGSWVDGLSYKNQTVFAALEADLSPETLLSAGISYQDNKSKGAMWGGLPVWFTDGGRTNWDRSKTTAADWTRSDNIYENHFASLEHTFANGWKVKGSYNHGDRYANSKLIYIYDSPDRTTGTGLKPWPGAFKVKTKQEDIAVQANGPFQLLGRTHELALGYTKSTKDRDTEARSYSNVATPGNFNIWDGSYAEPTWGAFAPNSTLSNTQEAVYGAARFSLADPLKLIVGARLTNFEQTASDAPGGLKLNVEGKVTPYAGLIYDINKNYSVYASYTDIFEPQTKRSIDKKFIDPVVGKSTEIGAKGDFLDGRLSASFAVFRTKENNLAQATDQYADTDTFETAYRATDATSRGFEFEVNGELARGWNASVGYTQFKLTDADGKDVNSIYPRKVLRLFSSYKLAGPLQGLTLGGGVNWQGALYTYAASPTSLAGTTEKIEQGSYALVNLMAKYEITKQLTAQLNVNNVFDKTYFTVFDAFGQITYGAPRNAVLTLNYKF
ncbi:MAG TPA: TonB-dependent siderophore receptor [Candidatus Aquabacterium excrementipullorum]|nr:TonB-dependent siderophore receptor [Candidatus Aquabacterium excrementipullorum]